MGPIEEPPAAARAGNRLRLYFSPGACSRVTMIALEQAGADYECTLVSLKDGAQHADRFRAINPKGQVPVLETPFGVLTENVAILAWIAAEFPDSHVLPVGAEWERARGLSMVAWFASTIHPLLTMLRYPALFCDQPAAQERVRQMARDKLEDRLRLAEDTLSDSKWLLGEQCTAADAYLHWTWERCAEAGIDGARFERIGRHRTRMERWQPVVQALQREQREQREVARRDA